MVRAYRKVSRMIASVALLMVSIAPMIVYAVPLSPTPPPPPPVSKSAAPTEYNKKTYGLDKISLVGAGDASPDIVSISGKIINWVLGFLGIIAVILVLIAGFQWMTADSEDKVKEARKRLVNSVIGLTIVALAWVIGWAVVNSIVGIMGPSSTPLTTPPS